MNTLSENSDGKILDDYRSFYKRHEIEGKRRILRFNEELRQLESAGQETTWETLRSRVELQIKLEELIIRWREAEHDKWRVYGPLVISILALLASLLVALFK